MIGDTAMMPGARLGVYRIQERIGVGGMGEVYRAHDTKLGRDVAIKILPRAFVGDPDRLARFEREARVLASLNHPNIGAIHGVEEDGGIRGLVLELIDGETLADRIGHGPIPIADAVRIGLQIADALDAAHEKGVIHRDLKPSNIKVTAAGVVKVLDFGLAKAITNDGASDASQVATITLNGTRAGLIVGTPAYMSPEQARGTAIDKRTDIWAFGCVLYEMLTGRATFARDTITDTLAAVVEREPDWSALPSKTPPAVRHLLRRCLDKNPTQRLRDIGEVRVALGERAVRQPLWHPAYRAAGLLILALSVVAGAVAFFYSPTRVPTTSPFEYAQITNFTDSAVAPSLSPDGRMVTFMRGGDAFLSRGQIYVKLLPNGESVQLTTDGGLKFGPVFTPDGSRIAYTRVTRAGWDTWTVPVLGGQPRSSCQMRPASRGSMIGEFSLPRSKRAFTWAS